MEVSRTTATGNPLPWLLLLALLAAVVAGFVLRGRNADRPLLFGTVRAVSPTTGRTFGEVRLSGRRVAIGQATLNVPGQGAIWGVPTPTGLAVRIDYSPADAPERLESADCPPDHPVLLSFPESLYLKGLLCRVV